MKTNLAGIALIKKFEGLRQTSYLCPAGVLTIGYGHTGPDVIPNQYWNMFKCEKTLAQDLLRFEEGVSSLVKVPLTEAQFSALVSFAFNLGLGALKSSTLLKKLNNGDYLGASEEFGRWVKAGGKTLPGLVLRRQAEKDLFCSK